MLPKILSELYSIAKAIFIGGAVAYISYKIKDYFNNKKK
jgi:hypothetical protein